MYGTYAGEGIARPATSAGAERMQRIMTLRRDIARLKGNVGISKIERDIASLENWWTWAYDADGNVVAPGSSEAHYTAAEACADLALPEDQRTPQAPWEYRIRSSECQDKRTRLDEKRLLLPQERAKLVQKEAELAALLAQPTELVAPVSEPAAPLLLPAPPPTFAPMPPSLPAEAAVLSRPSPNYLLWGGAAVAAYFFLRR